MKTRGQYTSLLLLGVSIFFAPVTHTLAATMTASATAPVTNGLDIANYGTGTGSDKWFFENSAALAPTIDRSTDPDGKRLFIFRRATAAKNDTNTSIQVEYGTTFGSWTTAVHQGSPANQITITEQTNGFGAGIDRVTVALPSALANGGKLFSPLKVIIQPL